MTVECMRCRHVGELTPEILTRLGIGSGTPIATFVKRLRCRKCGSRSVLATRKPTPQKASGSGRDEADLQRLGPSAAGVLGLNWHVVAGGLWLFRTFGSGKTAGFQRAVECSYGNY